MEKPEASASMTWADQSEPMVVVDHVSMVFNIANERIGSLKEYAIKIIRRELMFKEFKALDDVSFTVSRGDVFGLMGTNGSGKSTMLKIVAGVLEPTMGTCRVNGTIAPLIELGAGFDMELSARENIYLNGALLGYSKQFIEDHFDSIVEFADVEGFLDMPMKNYSSGMVARIAFAIATEVIPDILIVDEVLSVGDFMFQEKCERRIRSLIEDHGVTVLIVSHDSSMVERLCNKAIWIEKGKTRAIGNASDVCDLYRVLGGHSGSEEVAAKVQSIFEAEAEVPSNRISTLFADNSYSAAVKLVESIPGFRKADRFVLAPSDSEQVCFIANSVAGLLEAPLLLYRKDAIPDSTMSLLKEASPKRIVLVEGTDLANQSIVGSLKEELGCVIDIISGDSYAQIALNAYRFGQREPQGWSSTFAVTHGNMISDRVALSPYTYGEKVPVFFLNPDWELDAEAIEAINDSDCDCVMVVGCTRDIPEEMLEAFDEHVRFFYRFCYKNGYEAGIQIAEWITEHSDGFDMREIIVTSAYFPASALAVGPYASHMGRPVIMEDPQNLDSVVDVFEDLNSRKGKIDKLVFLGDSNTFKKIDRNLLAKSLVL